jgi:hypothetical protein
MAGERTLPGLGLTGNWDLGSPYKAQMDANLRLISGVAQIVVKSKDTALPGTPSIGDIYLVRSDDGTNPGKIAIWDGATGSEAWVYITPIVGWMAYVTDLADTYRFESDGWNVFSSGAGVATGGTATPITAQYWRIASMEQTAANGRSLAEIAFREAVGGADTAPASVSAFSTFSSFVAGNAVDGNPATIWSSDGSNVGEWFRAAFSAPVNLAEIAITARNDSNFTQSPQRFAVEYSDDDITWVRAGTTVEALAAYTAGSTKTFNLSTVTTVTGGGTGGGTGDPANYAASTPVSNATSWNLASADAPGTGGAVTATLIADDTNGVFGFNTLGNASALRYENPAKRPTLGADFDHVFNLSLMVPADNFAIAGIYVEASGTNKVYIVGKFWEGRWYRQYWNGNAFSSEGVVTSIHGDTDGTSFNGYMRLARVGATLFTYISLDGLSWLQIAEETIATHLGDIDRIGIMYNASSQSGTTGGLISVSGHDDTGPQARAVGTGGGGGGSSVSIEDEGVVIDAAASSINFVGAGVTVTDEAGKPTVTIPGGGGSLAVSEEGVAVVATTTNINFVGDSVTVTDVGGVATVTIATPTTSLYSAFDAADLTNVQPVLGGGMILRNSAYTGPAIRVADNLSTDEVDVPFDAFGRVSGARPYGDDTRLITVYDQWGTDDMTALKAVGITLVEEDAASGFYTWQIDFGTSTDGLFTASTGADNPPWEQANPLWALGHQRVTNGGLVNIHGAGSNGNFMGIGVWQEGADLHWRVDGSNSGDWTITDWVLDSPSSQNFARAIGDMTQRTGTAYAYYNGAAAGTLAYANPNDTYKNSGRYGYGNGDFAIGDDFNGLSSELHVFGSTGVATAGEITFIDTALAEVQTIAEFASGGGGGASTIEDLEGIDVTRSLLTSSHNGQALVWDFTAQAFIAAPPGFDSLRLGGGMDVLYSVADLALAPFVNVVLDEGTYALDQYDEIIIMLEGANTTLAIELSADGGTTPENLDIYQRSNATSYSALTRMKAGPNIDGSAGTAAIARITGFSLPDFPTVMECFGSSTANPANTMTQNGLSENVTRHNAISLYMTGGGSATSGRLYVVGVKKSRQPLEFGAKRSTTWGADTVLSEQPTQGAKFRSGTVGTVVLDVAPGVNTVFDVKDVAGTVFATGTVLAAATQADLVAATTGIITDEVRIIATGASGSATTARVSLRGEVA